MRYPCECPTKEPHACVKHFASFVVMRRGDLLKLCSHCVLTGDSKVSRLYTKTDIPNLVELDASQRLNHQASIAGTLLDMFGGIGTLFELHLDDLPLHIEEAQ